MNISTVSASSIPSEGTVVIKFGASWCNPCKMLTKILENKAYSIPTYAVDVDSEKEFTQKFGVRNIPTLVMLNNGVEVKREVGLPATNKLETFFREQ